MTWNEIRRQQGFLLAGGVIDSGQWQASLRPPSRVDRLLGVSPGECRRGDHPDTWRRDAKERLATYDQLPTDPDHDERDVDLLGELHFGFPHLTDEAPR